MSPGIFAANLAALEARSPALAQAVRSAAPAADVRVEQARNGDPIPVVRAEGRDWALHSRYDPRAEATRGAAAVSGRAFAVVLGVGAAYHLRALLASSDIAGVLAVESDPAHLRALAESFRLDDVLTDPRLELVAPADPAEVARLLLGLWLPVLSGQVVTVALEPRVRTAAAYFAAAASAVADAARRAADDLAVQARFGKRWFSNILGNLPAIACPSDWPRVGARACVAAAGPSLIAGAGRLARSIQEGSFLIATDTAGPALAGLGIDPRLVLSIDCQNVSYHHFLGGLHGQSRLVLDVGSPPMLARRAVSPLFLASPHPLAALLARTLLPLAPLDTSGGNVTHSAVALAFSLGAREVEVVGADFSYPAGSPYARGTYFFPHFQSRATRLEPADSSLAAWVLADGDLPPVREPSGLRYRSRRMEAYRAALVERFAPVDGPAPGCLVCRVTAAGAAADALTAAAGAGLPLQAPGQRDWRGWLTRYGAALRGLPRPQQPMWRFWAGLGVEERAVWTTLLPAIAAMPAGRPQERAEMALSWCTGRVEEVLRA